MVQLPPRGRVRKLPIKTLNAGLRGHRVRNPSVPAVTKSLATRGDLPARLWFLAPTFPGCAIHPEPGQFGAFPVNLTGSTQVPAKRVTHSYSGVGETAGAIMPELTHK